MFELGKAVIAQYRPCQFVEGKVAAIGVTDTGLYFYKVETEDQIFDWIEGHNVFTELESSSVIGLSEEDRAGMDEANRESHERFGPTDGTSHDYDPYDTARLTQA